MVDKLDRKEILRYLGYGAERPEEQIGAYIDEITDSFLRQCKGVYVTKRVEITALSQSKGEVLLGKSFCICSLDLAKDLQSCHEVLLFGATLGPMADRLIGRYIKEDISKGLIAEATATTMIEAYCDEICLSLAKYLKEKEEFLRPRFSPGYGDFDLKHQHELIRLLDASRRIGLSLTDSLMLAPSKSVTAVIGISKENSGEGGCIVRGCESCSKGDCLYKRARR